MWLLLKSEFNYQKDLLISMGIICLIYTLFPIFIESVFKNLIKFHPEFWTWIIGVGTFGLIITILISSRIKEFRDRFHTILPVNINDIAIARVFFLLSAPLIFVFYFIVIHLLIFPEYSLTSIKLIGFMSKGYVVLSSAILLWDLWFFLQMNYKWGRISIILTAILLITLSVILLNKFVDPVFYHILGERETVVALIWGTVIALFSVIFFQKRKSFLS